MRYNENVKKGFLESLSEAKGNFSENELEGLLSSRLSQMTESQSESFLSTLENIGKSIGEGVNWSNALQGAAQGAALGSTFSPGYGTAIGGIAGGILGALGVKPPAATVPAATVPAATVPAATVPAATVPAATVPAATALKLLDLLKSQKWDQVLAALVLGPDGKRCIPVGDKCIEIGEFLNSLKQLSSAAVSELAEMYASSDSYIESEDIDAANEEERADSLIKLLNSEKEPTKSNLRYTRDLNSILSEANALYIDLK